MVPYKLCLCEKLDTYYNLCFCKVQVRCVFSDLNLESLERHAIFCIIILWYLFEAVSSSNGIISVIKNSLISKILFFHY